MRGITHTTQQRIDHVMHALDQLAQLDLLSQLTSRLVVQYSGVSEGVMFRHFKNMDDVLYRWIHWRGEQLLHAVRDVPMGRNGLLYMVRELIGNNALLSFLCCHPMGNPDLREQLLIYRYKVRASIQQHITPMSMRPQHIPVEMLSDHLWISLCDVWRGETSMKEKLMSQLPWESKETSMPDPAVIQRLALNQSGFVFDPVSGCSFTANESGLKILQCLQQQQDMESLVLSLATEFDASSKEVERDVMEFVAQLRRLIK
ncbi:MAG: PqqD family protein [Mariprofundaceae bacterium]|nr:PqqD family protein [Mariprofundaceae bacterium]